MITPQETFEKFMRTHRMTHALHHKRRHDRKGKGETSRGQEQVIRLLQLKDGIATRDMADILGIRVSSLNETLARMEKAGYIDRAPSESDKRVMLIYLTDSGKQLQSPKEEFVLSAFADFSDEDLENFASYLDRLSQNIEHELGEDYQEFLERGRRRREEFFREAHAKHPKPPHHRHKHGECCGGGECGHGKRPPHPPCDCEKH